MMGVLVATVQKNRTITLVVLLALLLLGGFVWYTVTSPYRGTVSGTVISDDGAVRAVKLLVSDRSLEYYTYPGDTRASLVAAVPAPSGGLTAYLTRSRDKKMYVSVDDGVAIRPQAISSEEVSVPQWSQEGTSFAVSKRESESEAPEAWTVLRAVKQGDSLVVGSGVRPFPSHNQRTFALTTDGIALLAYSDTNPTIVVASPVPVPVTTPFSVSQDGSRVAWVAPADQSLQVFENVNGYFVPLHISAKSTFRSLVFSPDGRYLIGATHGGATTTLSMVKVSSGRTRLLGEYGGYFELHSWNYE